MQQERVRKLSIAPVGAVVALLAFLALAAPSQAATFAVDSTSDSPDASPGDGTCAAGSGFCTLVAAVDEANALPSDDVIKLPVGYFVIDDRLNLENNGSIRIVGMGKHGALSIIDANGEDRVMAIEDEPGTEVTLEKLTVKGGRNSQAAGIEVGSGAALSIDHVRIVQNTATREDGGGIYVERGARLDAKKSSFRGNSADNDGAALYVSAGGRAVLTDTRVISNTSDDDAAIEINGDNGFETRRADFVGTALKMTRVTIAGNHGEDDGALSIINANAKIFSSTIADNEGDNNFGGGGDGGVTVANGTLLMKDSTLAYNTTLDNDGEDAGNLEVTDGAVVTLERNLIGEGRVIDDLQNCDVRSGGMIVSKGYNASDDDSCGLTKGSDIQNQPLQMGRLRFNGGLSETIRIQKQSPAYDAGGFGCPGRDQRDVKRFNGKACDIGAFERKG